MVGDVDHLIRMKIADTMTTLYGAGETLMSCDQQEAIYQQVNNALLDLISLNVSIIISFLFVINYALYLCLKILLIQKVYNIRRQVEYPIFTVICTNALRKVHTISCQVLLFYINAYKETKSLQIDVDCFVVVCMQPYIT